MLLNYDFPSIGVFEKFKKCRAYETAFELKKEGKVKHVGISFHDKAEILEKILTEYPQIEAVQIQFNYADYDDVAVEGRKVYEVCRKFKKLTGMTIMEYILKTRIILAKNLLTKNISKGRISEECGFSSVSYFSRAFKNDTGKTPTQYRREQTKKQL